MIAAVVIAGLLTVLAVKSRAVAPALVLGVATVALLAVAAPTVVTGLGHVIAAVAAGIGDGLTHATS